MKTNDQKGLALPTSAPINPSIKGLGGRRGIRSVGRSAPAPGIQPRENKAVRQKTVAKECPLLPTPLQSNVIVSSFERPGWPVRRGGRRDTSTDRIEWALPYGPGWPPPRAPRRRRARGIDSPLLQAVGMYCLPARPPRLCSTTSTDDRASVNPSSSDRK